MKEIDKRKKKKERDRNKNKKKRKKPTFASAKGNTNRFLF